MWFEKSSRLWGGALRDEPKDGCEGDYSAVRKHQQTLKWLLDFDWLLRSYDDLILIFYWFISAG